MPDPFRMPDADGASPGALRGLKERIATSDRTRKDRVRLAADG
jgi:hypothetical protein